MTLLPPEIDTQDFSVEVAEDKELLDAVAVVRSLFQRIQTEMQQLAEQIDGVLTAA
jgi:hypothetical protein